MPFFHSHLERIFYFFGATSVTEIQKWRPYSVCGSMHNTMHFPKLSFVFSEKGGCGISIIERGKGNVFHMKIIKCIRHFFPKPRRLQLLRHLIRDVRGGEFSSGAGKDENPWGGVGGQGERKNPRGGAKSA